MIYNHYLFACTKYEHVKNKNKFEPYFNTFLRIKKAERWNALSQSLIDILNCILVK